MKPTHSRSFTDGSGNAGTVRTRPLRILSPIVHNAKPFLLSQYHHKSSQNLPVWFCSLRDDQVQLGFWSRKYILCDVASSGGRRTVKSEKSSACPRCAFLIRMFKVSEYLPPPLANLVLVIPALLSLAMFCPQYLGDPHTYRL